MRSFSIKTIDFYKKGTKVNYYTIKLIIDCSNHADCSKIDSLFKPVFDESEWNLESEVINIEISMLTIISPTCGNDYS